MLVPRSAVPVVPRSFTSTTSARAHVSEKRQEITAPATCGKTCLVPAYYGPCPSNDTTCLCSTPSVVQDVGSCVIKACTVQTERDATIEYMLGVCQSFGITVSVPSAIATFIPSTLIPPIGSHTQVPTSTPTIAASITNPGPSGPGLAATAGAISAAVAAILIAVVALVCWRRRRRTYRPHRPHHGGILGGMGGWRKALPVDRTDTVKSFFAGKEEGDDSSRGLLSHKSPRYWAPQRPSEPRVGFAALGGRTAPPVPVPVPRQQQHQHQHQHQQQQQQQQLSPPQPPPSHFKPAIWVGIPDDRARRPPRSASATPVSASAPAPGPSPSPAHSRAGSSDRYLDGLSPATSHLSPLVSVSTPFWGARPSFAGWDGNGSGSGNWGTPPSSASSPGAVPEKQRAWAGAAWERRAATEGSSVGVLHPLPPLPAAAGANAHSGFGVGTTLPPLPPPPPPQAQAEVEAQAARGHRRILTIDTTNINIEVLRPKSAVQRAPLGIAVAVPAPNPNPNPNPNARPNSNPYDADADAEDALATTAAELGRMFAADTATDASASSLSGHEIREAIRQRYHTSPTDGAHGDGDDACSPAVPESASMEMYGIGFGVMGRRWEPRSADVHANVNSNANGNGSTPSSAAGSVEGKRTAKSVRSARPPQVPGLRRFQSQVLTTRAAAVLSTFSASPSRSRTPSRTPSHASSPSPSRSRSRSARATPATPPPRLRETLTPTPDGGKDVVSTGTISSLIGGYGIAPTPSPSTPAANPQGGGAAAPGRDGGEGEGEDDDGDEGAPLVPASGGAPALSSLTPRRAPPRYSVVPQDFSEDGHGLSRDGTRRW